jgi:hypothetical protein
MLCFKKEPWLQMPETEGVTILWETDREASSTVLVFQTEKPNCTPTVDLISIGEPAVFTGDRNVIHKVRTTGLRPSCDYNYIVLSETEQETIQSAVYSFRTAPASGGSFSFAVTAEFGGYAEDEVNRKLAHAIGNFRPDFLLFAGDMVHDGLREEDWTRYLFHPFRQLLPQTPFYLCQGNHEKDAPFFYKFTAFPDHGNYYSFDYGDACFIALDSTKLADYSGHWPVDKKLLPPGDIGPGTPQFDFLEKTLAASEKKWKFVFFHYPVYVSGMWGVEHLRVFCPLFEKYGVDAVFTSHTMVYERSWPLRDGTVDFGQGVTYYVVGGAGAVREGKYPCFFYPKPEWHTAESFIEPHFLQVHIAGDRLEIKTRGMEGQLFDLFTRQK